MAAPPPQRPSDAYGFFIDSSHPAPTAPSEAEAALNASRTLKWRAMLASWEATRAKFPAVLKRRARKGIPNALRGEAWAALSGGAALARAAAPGAYAALLQAPLSRTDHYCISLDLHRTYPTHSLFVSPPSHAGSMAAEEALSEDAHLSPGQRALRNVLQAHAANNPAVGYIQGMGFVAGLLLVYMEEEQAFWTLQALTVAPQYRLDEVWAPGLVKYKEIMHVFGQLAAAHLPRLMAHFKAMGVEHSMYATEWFMSLFTYSFPFAVVTRVWDAFLCEGWKVIFRVALALLKVHQEALLGMELDELMPMLKRRIPALSREDPQSLLTAALALPLTTAGLAQQAASYRLDFEEELAEGVAAALADAVRKEQLLQDASTGTHRQLMIAARIPASSAGGGTSPMPSPSTAAGQGGFPPSALPAAAAAAAAAPAAASAAEGVPSPPTFPLQLTSFRAQATDGTSITFPAIKPITPTAEFQGVVLRNRSGERRHAHPSAVAESVHSDHMNADSGYGAIMTAVESVDVLLEVPGGGVSVLARGDARGEGGGGGQCLMTRAVSAQAAVGEQTLLQ